MLDQIDRKILHILSKDGAATATQIGSEVGLSIPSPCSPTGKRWVSPSWHMY